MGYTKTTMEEDLTRMVDDGFLLDALEYLLDYARYEFEKLEDKNRHYRAVIRTTKKFADDGSRVSMDGIKKILEDEDV